MVELAGGEGGLWSTGLTRLIHIKFHRPDFGLASILACQEEEKGGATSESNLIDKITNLYINMRKVEELICMEL